MEVTGHSLDTSVPYDVWTITYKYIIHTS